MLVAKGIYNTVRFVRPDQIRQSKKIMRVLLLKELRFYNSDDTKSVHIFILQRYYD
jgi:hypothetical protein